MDDLKLVDRDFPVCTYPPRLRSALERSVVIHLAGPASEHVRPDQPDVQRLPASRLDDRLATEITTLTSDERMLLATGDGVETDERWHDEQKASDEARVIAGLRSNALLEFLRAETAAFVRTREFRRGLDALARALVQRTDIGERDVRRILREAK